ncbi:MAG: lactate utilization protein [Thermodesulfobacteriota bacterium]
MNLQARIEAFEENARRVSTEVKVADTITAAFEYAVSVCRDKQACQVLAAGCEFSLSEPAEELCGLKQWQKLMAAPEIDSAGLEALRPLCRDEGIGLVDRGLHEHLGGIDVGLTRADFGIAGTGSIVIDCAGENLRLATMISEIHVAILRAADICAEANEIESALKAQFFRSPNYTAFITGPSRTADIERVLTLGVHGPLELHVVIVNDQ